MAAFKAKTRQGKVLTLVWLVGRFSQVYAILKFEKSM